MQKRSHLRFITEMPPSFRHIKVALHHDETRFAAGSLANRCFLCESAVLT